MSLPSRPAWRRPAKLGTPAAQVQEINVLLRDPDGDISLEDLAKEVLKPIRAGLNDPEKFPPSLPSMLDGSCPAIGRYFIKQIQEYDKTLEPAF